MVGDDGGGFDVNRSPTGSLGMGIMRERAESVGASLSMTSRPGHGTVVTVKWQRRTERADGAVS